VIRPDDAGEVVMSPRRDLIGERGHRPREFPHRPQPPGHPGRYALLASPTVETLNSQTGWRASAAAPRSSNAAPSGSHCPP
jgi:hypothetical protein